MNFLWTNPDTHEYLVTDSPDPPAGNIDRYVGHVVIDSDPVEKLLKQGFQLTDHNQEYFIYLNYKTGKYALTGPWIPFRVIEFDTFEEALTHFRSIT